MFKICEIVEISKIDFLNFSGTERVTGFFTGNLALSLPVTRYARQNTDLPSNSNISKTVRLNIAFAKKFFKRYSISFLMIFRLIDFALVVLYLLMFKIGGTQRVKKG